MIYEVKMPSLGADMDKGKLMDWKIKVGDKVIKGQSIALVETTKSTVEIESFREGEVLELVGHLGDDIPVGQVIATFDVQPDSLTVEAITDTRLKISPRAKKMAQDHGVNIDMLKGTGTKGEISSSDVENFLTSQNKSYETDSTIRDAIAKAMSKSKREIPHYYLKIQVNLKKFMIWLDKKNGTLKPEDRIMLSSAFLYAVNLSLKEHPEMNGHYENGIFQPSSSVNMGIAISLKSGGVLVPAILNSDEKNLMELNQSFQDLIIRTRNDHLKNSELTEGTVTVTNIGDSGVDEVYGVIFPPQVAIIGFGRVAQSPIVENNNLTLGYVVNITLSADHRVTDGLNGSKFLSKIENILLHPEQMDGGV